MPQTVTRRTIGTVRGPMTWLEAGAGWPLVLLHAFPLTAEMWRPQLERVPDDMFEWQAHPKSHTIGWNASHVADLPNWLVAALTTPSATR